MTVSFEHIKDEALSLASDILHHSRLSMVSDLSLKYYGYPKVEHKPFLLIPHYLSSILFSSQRHRDPSETRQTAISISKKILTDISFILACNSLKLTLQKNYFNAINLPFVSGSVQKVSPTIAEPYTLKMQSTHNSLEGLNICLCFE